MELDEDTEYKIKEHLEQILFENLQNEVYTVPRFLYATFQKNFQENYFIDVYSIKNTAQSFKDALDDTETEIKQLKEGWKEFKSDYQEDEGMYAEYIDTMMTDWQQNNMLWARGEEINTKKKASHVYDLEEFEDILNCMDGRDSLESDLDYYLQIMISEEFEFIFVGL